jgi:hypothetical protein
LANVLGTDPVGGLVDGALGTNNAVSQITGTPASSTTPGLVPKLATAIQSGTNTATIGKGLGVTGAGGLVSDLIGNDSVGGITGETGVVGANVAGGNDGLLGNVLGGNKPLLPGVGDLVAKSGLDNVVSPKNGLGISGENGLVQDLIGTDAVGHLIGTTNGSAPTLVGGGDAGALGHVLPGNTPLLASVGTTVNNVLGAVAGTSPSPVTGILQGGTSGAPLGNILSGVPGATGNLPVVGNVLPGVTGGSGSSPVGNVLSTVTNATGNLPVVGNILSGAPSGGSNPISNVLSTVGNVTGSLPVVGNVVSGVTSGSGTNPLGTVLSTVTNVTNGVPVVGNVLSTVTNATGGSNGGSASASIGLLGILKVH